MKEDDKTEIIRGAILWVCIVSVIYIFADCVKQTNADDNKWRIEKTRIERTK
jgi:hypothetical protein